MTKDIATTTRIRRVKGSVGKVVKLLSGKDMPVTQVGSTAYVEHDRHTMEVCRVNIPVIADNSTNQFLDAIEGFVDHEVGHVLFTDGEPTRIAADESPALDCLRNIVEDVFVERRMRESFTGSDRNIDNLSHMFLEKFIEPEVAKLKASGNADEKDWFNVIAVPLIRSLGGQQIFTEWLNDRDLIGNIPKVHKSIEPLSGRLCAIKDSWESLQLARDIIKAIQDVNPIAQMDKQKQADNDDEEGDNSGNSSSDADGSEDSEKSEGSKQSSESNRGEDGEDRKESEKNNGDGGASSKQENEDSDGDDESGDGSSGGDEEGSGGDEKGDDASGHGSEQHEDEAGDNEGDNGNGSKTESQGKDADSQSGDNGQNGSNSEGEAGSESDGDGSSKGNEQIAGGVSKEDNNGGEADPTMQGGGGVGGAEDNSDSSNIALNDIKPESFDNAISYILSGMADETHSESKYLPFSTNFDVIGPLEIPKSATNRPEILEKLVKDIEDTTSHMVGPMTKQLERAFRANNRARWENGKRSGHLNTSGLYRLSANDDRVFRNKQITKTRKVAVTLLIDMSGSMSNSNKIGMAAEAAWALASVLNRLNINFEVLGFTTMSAHSGGKKLKPGSQDMMNDARLNEVGSWESKYARGDIIHMPIMKSFAENFTIEAKRRLAYVPMYRPRIYNIDGESVRYAADRLLTQREEGKTLIVLSDGMPCGGVSYDCKLREHLKQTVTDVTKEGVNVVGIGICSNAVERFYPKSVVLNNVNDLPLEVVAQLRTAILQK